MPAGRSRAGIFTNRLPDALRTFVPLQIVSAIGMTFFLVAGKDVVRLSPAISRYHYGTETQTLRSSKAFGEVDLTLSS